MPIPAPTGDAATADGPAPAAPAPAASSIPTPSRRSRRSGLPAPLARRPRARARRRRRRRRRLRRAQGRLHRPGRRASSGPSSSARPRSSRLARPGAAARILAWVAALLVASVGLGVFVAQSLGPARGRRLGQRRHPPDQPRPAARGRGLAHGRAADFVDAIAIYDEVLADQPANTEALTYKGWLLYLTSRQTQDAGRHPDAARPGQGAARQRGRRSIRGYGDARVFRASVLRALGLDAAGAGRPRRRRRRARSPPTCSRRRQPAGEPRRRSAPGTRWSRPRRPGCPTVGRLTTGRAGPDGSASPGGRPDHVGSAAPGVPGRRRLSRRCRGARRCPW